MFGCKATVKNASLFLNVVNLRSQKKRSLLVVNEHFFDKRNEAGGHYGETPLIKNNVLHQ